MSQNKPLNYLEKKAFRLSIAPMMDWTDKPKYSSNVR